MKNTLFTLAQEALDRYLDSVKSSRLDQTLRNTFGHESKGHSMSGQKIRRYHSRDDKSAFAILGGRVAAFAAIMSDHIDNAFKISMKEIHAGLAFFGLVGKPEPSIETLINSVKQVPVDLKVSNPVYESLQDDIRSFQSEWDLALEKSLNTDQFGPHPELYYVHKRASEQLGLRVKFDFVTAADGQPILNNDGTLKTSMIFSHAADRVLSVHNQSIRTQQTSMQNMHVINVFQRSSLSQNVNTMPSLTLAPVFVPQ